MASYISTQDQETVAETMDETMSQPSLRTVAPSVYFSNPDPTTISTVATQFWDRFASRARTPLPNPFSISSNIPPSSHPSIAPATPHPFPMYSFSNDIPSLTPLRPHISAVVQRHQTASQRIMSLRRYIQDTIHRIEDNVDGHRNPERLLPGLTEGFPMFAKLPTEIQLMIWKFAIPDARDVSNAILVIVNHDLNDVKAILPKPKEYKQIYSDMFARTAQSIAMEGEHLELDPDDYRWNVSKHMVFSMLQTCHNSRAAALKTFCLDVAPINTKAMQKFPWSAEDRLYFPCLGYSFERRMALQWLSRSRETPSPSLAAVHHIALPLERILLQSLGITRVFLGRNPGRNQWDNGWFTNMPNLKSFGLYLDPGDVSEKDQGTLCLYEPEDVPMLHCSRYKPSEAEKAVQGKLKELRGAGLCEPDVEVSVLCWKKPKGYTSKAGKVSGQHPLLGFGPAGVTLRLNVLPETQQMLRDRNRQFSDLRLHLTTHPL